MTGAYIIGKKAPCPSTAIFAYIIMNAVRNETSQIMLRDFNRNRPIISANESVRNCAMAESRSESAKSLARTPCVMG
jgi:hypothetical protein